MIEGIRRPAETRPPPVRWGVPDGVLCWLGGMFAAAVVAAPLMLSGSGSRHEAMPASTFLVVLPAQNLVVLAALFWVSRAKGIGTWRADFGWELRRRDAGALVLGIALQAVITLALFPLVQLADRTPSQELVRLMNENSDVLLSVGILVSTVVLAPLVEELLFRGLLLRSLLRRLEPATAILVSGIVFGAVHLLDPGALVAVPGLALLGTILSVVAFRTGSLSRPILIHAGFNLVTTVVALLS